MADYTNVKKELEAGTPPELICAMCPWDRLCITPPTMSSVEVERLIKEAEQKDLEKDPQRSKMPMGMLMATIAFAGRDSQAQLCPVFASRLTGPDGRSIADTVREQMRTWPGSEA